VGVSRKWQTHGLSKLMRVIGNLVVVLAVKCVVCAHAVG